jgi:hypothetical protein
MLEKVAVASQFKDESGGPLKLYPFSNILLNITMSRRSKRSLGLQLVCKG